MPQKVWIYFIALFLVGSVKRFFPQEWRFSSSRSSKVIDVGTNRKRLCDFLLVRNSNFGHILHRFGDIPAFMCFWPHPHSTLILGVFLLHQIAHVGVSVSRDLKPWNWNYFRSIPNCVKNIPQRHGQTDRLWHRKTSKFLKKTSIAIIACTETVQHNESRLPVLFISSK